MKFFWNNSEYFGKAVILQNFSEKIIKRVEGKRKIIREYSGII
jgi:hypothetical protein